MKESWQQLVAAVSTFFAGGFVAWLRSRSTIRQAVAEVEVRRADQLVDQQTEVFEELRGQIKALRDEQTADRKTISGLLERVADLTLELGAAKGKIAELEAANRILAGATQPD